MLATMAIVPATIQMSLSMNAPKSGRGRALASSLNPPRGTSTNWLGVSASEGTLRKIIANTLETTTRTSAGDSSANLASGVRFQPYSMISERTVMMVGPTAKPALMSDSPPETPSATGACLMTMVIPMAASIPLITEDGTSDAYFPARNTPKRNCMAPARITAVRKRSIVPRRSTSISTMEIKPAAGPDTESGERLISGTTMPPTIPATSPLRGDTPLAIAMPRHSGNATRNTTIPATKSCRG